MFKALFGRATPGISPGKLPQVNGFVDVIVAGRRMRSVAVEAVTAQGIVTSELLGEVGETAVIVYTVPAGRFRARTRIVSTNGMHTTFAMPRSIEGLNAAQAAQKRQTVRLDALVPGYWRFAPGGTGIGEFARGSVRDISRGGCALTAERALKEGTTIEIKLDLKSGEVPLVLLAAVVRHQAIPSSAKHAHGLRFQGIRPEEDQAIIDFINRKQAELRNRGLA